MKTNARERGAMWAAGAAALALGLVLRSWGLFSTPLWLDEAYSTYAAGRGFAFIWHVVPLYETHPPFYYSLLRSWTLVFGDGLAAVRALGAVAGVATLPLLWLGGRAYGLAIGFGARRSGWTALVALALGCVSIPLVAMAHEVRPYPLLILAYAAAVPVLLRLARGAAAGGLERGPFALYLLLLLLVLWLHNLGALFAAALGLALLIAVVGRGLGPRGWSLLVAGHALVAAAWVPALLILRDQAPTWIAHTWLAVDLPLLPPRLATLYAVPGWAGAAGAALLALAAIRLWSRATAMLLVLALVPVALSLAVSFTVAPIFIMRTMTPVAAPTLLLLAAATVSAPGRRWIGWLLGATVAANMLAVDLQARAEGPPEDWYGMLDWLAPRMRPGDVVLAYPNEGALPLARALGDRGMALPVRPVPEPVPSFARAGDTYPNGSRGVVALAPARARRVARVPVVTGARTVWLLRIRPDLYDRNDAFLRVLATERAVAARWRAYPIDLVGLSRRD